MTHPATPTANHVWRFANTDAGLSVAPLCGEVTLSNPEQGIHRLAWRGQSINGSVLGVSAGTPDAPQDAFARESDLVAVYAQTEPQIFTWEVYWRAAAPAADVVLLDVILSLQTPLLESFPRVTTQSQLPVGEVSTLAGEGDCVVVRPNACEWSYAEMTHPKDRGTLEIVPAAEIQLERHLGGQFMEKGVIRRLRVRGVFLPRENDLALAATYCEQLAAETPPLTA